ncbi:MAG: hypothetical protein WCV99_23800 [Sterolibacterium sp.]
MNDQRTRLSQAFTQLVSDKFSFLRSEFGYKQLETCFPNLELSHGGSCALHFGNAKAKICLEVFLDFETYWVDVIILRSVDGTFVEHSVWGQSEKAAAILLSALAGWRNATSFNQDLLPQSLPSISWRDKQRRLLERRTVINERLEDVVQNVAMNVTEFAPEVLRGDTTMFSEVQAFYRKQQNVTLSPDGRRVELGFTKSKDERQKGLNPRANQ